MEAANRTTNPKADAPSVPANSTQSETNNTPARSQQRQFRFDVRSDIALLKEVQSILPFQAGHGKVQEAWNDVSQNINSFLDDNQPKTTGPSCKHHFDDLLEAYRKDNMEALRASGTDEEYDERQQLLDGLSEMVFYLKETLNTK